jgi:hypothetical protein
LIIVFQIIAVNKQTGQVRVSRKKLLSASDRDELAPQPPDEADPLLEPLPDFPVIPPRAWNRQFFR